MSYGSLQVFIYIVMKTEHSINIPLKCYVCSQAKFNVKLKCFVFPGAYLGEASSQLISLLARNTLLSYPWVVEDEAQRARTLSSFIYAVV